MLKHQQNSDPFMDQVSKLKLYLFEHVEKEQQQASSQHSPRTIQQQMRRPQ